jgi:NADPH-dependent 7-cyano-7-deazaguanine reductase QueF
MQNESLDPARRAALADALVGAFGPLDAAALAEVGSKLDWVSLAGGETLFRQGEHGDDVYVVVNGRLRAVADDPVGGVRVLEESGRGSAVGELGLLTGEPRAATIVAVRDIAVTTTCPHHLLPAIGRATVAFKATNKVIGIGTVAALVDAHARRLALQENIGEAIVDDLVAVLAPEWVGCRLVLTHGCMIARGERAHGTSVETLASRGSFDTSFLR